MNILQIVPTLGYGGVAKVVLNYYEQIDHKQFHFDFVTHGKREKFHGGIVAEGSLIFYFSTIGKIGLKGYFEQICKTIDMSNYDIVHLHIAHLNGLYGYLYKFAGAKKIICHAHASRCVVHKHEVFMPLFRILANTVSDKRISCGVKAGKFCFGKGEFSILNNGLSFCKINEITNKQVENAKREFNIPNDTLIVGHVGLFSSPKNHKFIVNIINELLKKESRVIFVLVGDGELKESIEKQIKNNNNYSNVRFTGIREDVYTLMKMFDVFILPSLFEGLPVVGIEAQAAGTRCLFSKEIDNSVDIGAGLVQFIPIDQGPKLWVDALLENIGKTSYLNVDKVYSKLCDSGYEISITARQLLAIYDELINKPN